MDDAQIRIILGTERIDRFDAALDDLVRAVSHTPVGVDSAAALHRLLLTRLSSALTLATGLSEGGPELARQQGPSGLDLRIGRCITQKRKKLRMSRVGLARRLKVNSGLLKAWETGATRVPASELVVIAHALGLSFVDLFTGSKLK